jgi:hypothetical protein
MSSGSIAFGWGAPSFAEQVPELSEADAERADAFNKAIVLLSVHGILTEAERDRAIKRATRRIERALAQAIEARRAETQSGSACESAVGEAEAPTPSPGPASGEAAA